MYTGADFFSGRRDETAGIDLAGDKAPLDITLQTERAYVSGAPGAGRSHRLANRFPVGYDHEKYATPGHWVRRLVPTPAGGIAMSVPFARPFLALGLTAAMGLFAALAPLAA